MVLFPLEDLGPVLGEREGRGDNNSGTDGCGSGTKERTAADGFFFFRRYGFVLHGRMLLDVDSSLIPVICPIV
jgi:hypothetical protein